MRGGVCKKDVLERSFHARPRRPQTSKITISMVAFTYAPSLRPLCALSRSIQPRCCAIPEVALPFVSLRYYIYNTIIRALDEPRTVERTDEIIDSTWKFNDNFLEKMKF